MKVELLATDESRSVTKQVEVEAAGTMTAYQREGDLVAEIYKVLVPFFDARLSGGEVSTDKTQ